MYFIDIKTKNLETNNLKKFSKFSDLLFYTLQCIIILHFCFNNKLFQVLFQVKN